MQRSLDLRLKDFVPVPAGLQTANSSVAASIDVRLADLFHHYWRDAHYQAVPSPNPIAQWYISLLTPDAAFRFRGPSVGTHKEPRIAHHNLLGKAFCRWFLSAHCGITYFAHMEHVLKGTIDPMFGSIQVTRVGAGDTPDYLCAENAQTLCLAEAKGTAASISFTNAEFGRWRQQFDRVEFRDANGVLRVLKGYIVATRFVSEDHSENVRSALYAEDPRTRGDVSLNVQQEEGFHLARATIAGHYGVVLDKLRLPLLATALRQGTTLPADLPIRMAIWECLVAPVQQSLFVGGYFDPPDWPAGQWPYFDFVERVASRLCLSAVGLTFFGLEIGAFQTIRNASLSGRATLSDVTPLRFEAVAPTELSVFRDGTILGPVDFFRFREIQEF